MRPFTRAIMLAALAACGTEPDAIPPAVALAQHHVPPRFRVVVLSSTLGGGRSRGSSIDDRGAVVGYSNLPGDTLRHAVRWRHGARRDLGTLGGPNSSVQWHGQNDRGTIVGISELRATDPLGEAWSCSAFFPSVTHHVCRGFVWEDGVMTRLPTLGGHNGYATGVNNRGQVVGWAETRVHDPTCNRPQVLQFRAAIWESARGRTTPLRPLPGDSTSAATAINDLGQVVGISGECDVAVGRFSARHAVLWDHGRVTDIGNLGGTSWHTPTAINQGGDIVGFSNPDLPGDAAGEFLAHAFLRVAGRRIRDLGTLAGDETSQALGINARRQVVGVSTAADGTSRAFFWDNGVMTDLNGALVGAGPGGRLLSARDITDDGRITGDVLLPNGTTAAFLAIPAGGRP